MKLFNIKSIFKSTIEVEIEGYFVERYINLCRSSNIKIWNIKQLSSGKICFVCYAKDLKKMKSIVKKSKCKLKVVNKYGLYFKFLKYKKRRITMYILALIIISIYISSKFIWKIDIMGMSSIENDEILIELKKHGIKPRGIL